MPRINIEEALAEEIEKIISVKKEAIIEDALRNLNLRIPYKDFTKEQKSLITIAIEDLSKSISATILR